MNSILLIIMHLMLCGCTYSITMAHTEGAATDIIDETNSNTPSTSLTPTLTIPIQPLK